MSNDYGLISPHRCPLSLLTWFVSVSWWLIVRRGNRWKRYRVAISDNCECLYV